MPARGFTGRASAWWRRVARRPANVGIGAASQPDPMARRCAAAVDRGRRAGPARWCGRGGWCRASGALAWWCGRAEQICGGRKAATEQRAGAFLSQLRSGQQLRLLVRAAARRALVWGTKRAPGGGGEFGEAIGGHVLVSRGGWPVRQCGGLERLLRAWWCGCRWSAQMCASSAVVVLLAAAERCASATPWRRSGQRWATSLLLADTLPSGVCMASGESFAMVTPLGATFLLGDVDLMT